MQFAPELSRDALVELAIEKYFASVDGKDIDAVLDCFHDTSSVCVQTAFARHNGKAELRRMYLDFFDSFDVIVHKDFTCTVDEANGRIAASFEAVLTKDGSKTQLFNTNFWRVRDGKFQDVYIYMSGTNPLV